MENWILNEFITLKEREILKITLLSAGYDLSGSLDLSETGVTDGFISTHKHFSKQICRDGGMMIKQPITYDELMSYLKKKIEENENSRRDRCKVGDL